MTRAALLLSLALSVAGAEAQRRTPAAVRLDTLRLPAGSSSWLPTCGWETGWRSGTTHCLSPI